MYVVHVVHVWPCCGMHMIHVMYVFMYVHNVMYVCTAHVVHTYMYMYTHDIHVCIINVYFKNDSIHDVMYIDMCTHTTCMCTCMYVKLHVCVEKQS